MRQNKPRVHIGLGVATIFMVFMILCFTILATLAFMNAKNQDNTSKKFEQSIQEYYRADAEANHIREKIEENLQNITTFCAEKGYYYNADLCQVEYEVEIDKFSILKVELQIEANKTKIISWIKENRKD